jgi:hypothetical protein
VCVCVCVCVWCVRVRVCVRVRMCKEHSPDAGLLSHMRTFRMRRLLGGNEITIIPNGAFSGLTSLILL